MTTFGRRDFAADARSLCIAAAAAVLGLTTIAAHVLLQLIRLFANVFFDRSAVGPLLAVSTPR